MKKVILSTVAALSLLACRHVHAQVSSTQINVIPHTNGSGVPTSVGVLSLRSLTHTAPIYNVNIVAPNVPNGSISSITLTLPDSLPSAASPGGCVLAIDYTGKMTCGDTPDNTINMGDTSHAFSTEYLYNLVIANAAGAGTINPAVTDVVNIGNGSGLEFLNIYTQNEYISGTSYINELSNLAGVIQVSANLIPITTTINLGGNGTGGLPNLPFNTIYGLTGEFNNLGSENGLGNVTITSNLVPSSSTWSLGSSGTPFNDIYGFTYHSGSSNGVTASGCSQFTGGICTSSGSGSSGTILPSSTLTYNLGSASFQWDHVFAFQGVFGLVNVAGTVVPNVSNSYSVGTSGAIWGAVYSNSYVAGTATGVTGATCTAWTAGLCTHL